MSSRHRSLKRKYQEEIRKQSRNIVQFCSQLIKIPSENPPGDTSTVAYLLKDYLQNAGITVSIYQPQKGLLNLVTSIGSDLRPNLVFNAHMDVYPAETGSGMWTLPSFSGKVANGKIFGRGAADMKCGLALLIQVFLLLSKLEKLLQGKVTLTIVSDEEGMGDYGTEWLLNRVEETRGDACLSSESTSPGAIGIGERAFVWFRLKSYGRSIQGAHPALGENAITKLTQALTAVDELNGAKFSPPAELVSMIHNQKAYWKKLHGEQVGEKEGELLDRASFSVTRIEGGKFIGLIPDFCQAEINGRLPIGAPLNYFEEQIPRMLREAGLRGVDIEVFNKNRPNYTSPNERIAKLLADNVREKDRCQPVPIIGLGATDQWRFRVKGIPSVKYGPTAYSIGGVDEYVLVGEIIRAAEIHLGTSIDYLTEGMS